MNHSLFGLGVICRVFRGSSRFCPLCPVNGYSLPSVFHPWFCSVIRGPPFLPSFIRVIRVIRVIRGSPFLLSSSAVLLPSYRSSATLNSVGDCLKPIDTFQKTSSDPSYNAIISPGYRYDFVTIRGALHMGGGVR